MVAEYIAFGRRFDTSKEITFLRGARQIPPAHYLKWSHENLVIVPYWTPQNDPLVEKLSSSESLDRLRLALDEVIDMSLADAEVGCLVSGGLDSSLIASIATQRAKKKGTVHLLTLGHNIDCPEERSLQKNLARHLRTAILVPAQILPRLQVAPLRELNRVSDAPAGGLFTGVYQEVLEEARVRGINVILTGEGGDEVFAPHPFIIADLMIRRKILSAVQAVAFFASLNGEISAPQVFYRSGLLPVLASRVDLKAKKALLAEDLCNRGFLVNFLGPFYDKLTEAYQRAVDDARHRLAAGFSFSSYYHYQQLIEIPFYEPACGRQGMPRIINPLAGLSVFQAAMSLRLEERIGTWVGCRPKQLLYLLAAGILPPDVYRHPKIGVSNLLSQMTLGIESELGGLLGSGVFDEIGLIPAPNLLDPRSVPPTAALYWALLLTLAVWFEELRQGVTARKRRAQTG